MTQGKFTEPDTVFVMYIIDLPDLLSLDVCLFTDDTKIFRTIKNAEDPEKAQEDLLELQEWSNK